MSTPSNTAEKTRAPSVAFDNFLQKIPPKVAVFSTIIVNNFQKKQIILFYYEDEYYLDGWR